MNNSSHKAISELQSITSHMGPHSGTPVTRNRQMHPNLTANRQTGIQFTYHGKNKGRVDLGGWLYKPKFHYADFHRNFPTGIVKDTNH